MPPSSIRSLGATWPSLPSARAGTTYGTAIAARRNGCRFENPARRSRCGRLSGAWNVLARGDMMGHRADASRAGKIVGLRSDPVDVGCDVGLEPAERPGQPAQQDLLENLAGPHIFTMPQEV